MPPTRGIARNPWLDRIDIQLAFSRDGLHWERAGERHTFLPNGPEGSHDAGMIFVAQQPVVREDLGEIWIYYVGFKKGHWGVRRGENQESSVSLARLRLDGFVSVAAGKGSLTTKPLVCRPAASGINASTAGDGGSLKVELLDPETQQPLAGYAEGDCDAFQGDEVRHTITWKDKSELGQLEGKKIQIRFQLRRAKLFSFQFH